jgi:hypothetical protein
MGLVASYREPGGNVTGSCQQLMEMTPKFFEVLKEFRPGGRRGSVLLVEKSRRERYMDQAREEMQMAGAHLGIEVVEVVVPDDLLFVPDDIYGKPVLAEVLVHLREARLPTLYTNAAIVRRGGLVSP